jgi:hypothetical protein
MEELPQVPHGDVQYHLRQAARLRELASTATTGPVKARLVQEAEEHERLARGAPASIAEDEG